ncbi:sugar nucleotide-binding protein [Myxococcota bacterium]|nr:sugar nucleotide-binding protein [Myxococcota bacterium]
MRAPHRQRERSIERSTGSPVPCAPELWGGVECTVNRVGDRYFDQLERSGHAQRIEDLDAFAGLGLRALRYPLLWERLAPDAIDEIDWTWADARVARILELGMRPIIGLVHHGSGPRYTSIVDPSFHVLLGELAARVAERYPMIDAYTPVNEPVTTARFSGLYGLWHPHGRTDRTFVRALLEEVLGVRAAMTAIRAVNPDAELVQTEDLGRISFTDGLEREARFRDHRRWLAFDLLFGRVDHEHPMWSYLVAHGAQRAELESLLEAPCPPDLIGVNHYLTSDRILVPDPEGPHLGLSEGGDAGVPEGAVRYRDVEAVRACLDCPITPIDVLREAAARYGRPVAITEVHLGCTREEQLRWFEEVWRGAEALAREGLPVRAVTAWALLGSFDWDSLVVEDRGSYEPGLFDVRGPAPRPTALAWLARARAIGGAVEHPVLEGPAWWRRVDRLTYAPAEGRSCARPGHVAGLHVADREPRPLVIVGSRGTLARALARICEVRGLTHVVLSSDQMDLLDPRAVDAALAKAQPWAVINASGYVRVDDAEHDVERCHALNAIGPAVLAAACARRGARLATFSSDLVFGGDEAERRARDGGPPWTERDGPAPANVYGRAKLEGEVRVRTAMPSALVIRTSAFFGPWDLHNFVTTTLDALERGEVVPVADDTWIAPTYVPDLANATLDLLVDGEQGLWHLANDGAVTWADLAEGAARAAGVEPKIRRVPMTSLGLGALRPAWSVLASARGTLLPTLDHALGRYLTERRLDDARPALALPRAAAPELEGEDRAQRRGA